MPVKLSSVASLLQRTEGASAAFIRELFRKAALMAADESNGTSVEIHDRHMDLALKELVFDGGELTRNFLGYRSTAGPRD